MSAPVAFAFPGQGTQFPGMGRELQRFGAASGELVARAEEFTGLPVMKLMTTAERRRQAMHTLMGMGARTFVEVGPGRVLGGLGREAVRTAEHQTLQDALRAAAPAPYGRDDSGGTGHCRTLLSPERKRTT